MVLQIVFGLPDLTISHIDSNEHKIDEEINNSNFYFLLLLIRFFLKFIEKKKNFHRIFSHLVCTYEDNCFRIGRGRMQGEGTCIAYAIISGCFDYFCLQFCRETLGLLKPKNQG